MSDSNNNNHTRDFIYTVPEKVFIDTTLSINDLKIYMIIRSFMDTTGAAYPSNNWISKKLGIHRTTVITCINNLLKKKYIIREEYNGRRYLRINIAPIPEEVVVPTLPPSSVDTTPPSSVDTTQLDQSNIISKEIKKRGKASRTPIPNDFCPNEINENFAHDNKLNVTKEVGAFIDYYTAHGKTMANWQSAFGNWLRKAVDFRGQKKTTEHPVTASIREVKDIMRSREFLSLVN